MSKRQSRLLHRRKLNNANRSVTPARNFHGGKFPPRRTRASRWIDRSRTATSLFFNRIRLPAYPRSARVFPTRDNLSTVHADGRKFFKNLKSAFNSSNFESLKSQRGHRLLFFLQRGKKSKFHRLGENSHFTCDGFMASVCRTQPVWRNGRRTGLKILGL
jgi:hypothetical protein